MFDLDPGLPATIVDCCRVALRLRRLLADLGLRAWPKTSGGAGLHVYVPVDDAVDYQATKAFARALARVLERDDPGSVTSSMSKARRPGKVFVDWSQNDAGKSTVAPYSVRGFEIPTVSMPVGWDDVEEAAEGTDPGRLTFLPDDALGRLDTGDLFAAVLDTSQTLPALSATGD